MSLLSALGQPPSCLSSIGPSSVSLPHVKRSAEGLVAPATVISCVTAGTEQRRGVAVVVGEVPAEVHGGLAGAYAQDVTSDVGP